MTPRIPTGLMLAIAVASPAAADPRPSVPRSVALEHVMVHYDDKRTEAQAREAGGHVEKAWRRLVDELGFRRPDGDGQTGGGTDLLDIYLAPPVGDPEFNGGQAMTDDNGKPFLIATRIHHGLLAHEFMHTIQTSYSFFAGVLVESTANWAVDVVYPDRSTGGDSEWSLAEERLPFDCSYGEWFGRNCGNGYRQSLFLGHVTHWIGPAFMRRTFELAEGIRRESPGQLVRDDRGVEALRRALAEAGHDFLKLFDRHVTAVNDPPRSPLDFTGAFNFGGAPGEKLRRPNNAFDDDPVGLLSARKRSTKGSLVLPHLAWRAVRFRGYAGTARKRDRLKVSLAVTHYTPSQAPRIFTGRKALGRHKIRPMKSAGSGRWTLTIPFSQTEAFAGQALVLVNDSYTDDDARFTWSAKIVRG